MVQIFDKAELERKDIIILIPEKEEIEEKIKEKIEQKPKKKLFKKYSKSHEKQIDINKARRNLDAKLHTNKFIMR